VHGERDAVPLLREGRRAPPSDALSAARGGSRTVRPAAPSRRPGRRAG